MEVLLEAVIRLVVRAPAAGALVARLRGEPRRPVSEAPLAAWTAAALLLGAVVPLAVLAAHLVLVAGRSLSDDILFLLGLLLFLPLALVAVGLVVAVSSAALAAAHGLLTAADHGRQVFVGCALAGAAVGAAVMGSGLLRPGLVTAGLALLAGGCAALGPANA